MWKKIVMGVLLVLSAVAGFGVAKVQSTMDNTLNQINRDKSSALKDVDLSDIKVESDNDIVNILLIGNDKRTEKVSGFRSDGLTDAMMIATMDKKHNTLKLTTLMRDTLVEVTKAEQIRKLNSASNYGGIKNLYKTIAKNFNIKLDGYAMVDFNAFKDVVNAVGGVEVEVTDTEARYLSCTNYIRRKKNRHLKVGKQTLNGDQALGWCRIRKGKDKIGEPVVTANGLMDDYGRTWRQRTLINAIFEKMKKLAWSEWIDIANVALANVQTDLTNKEIMGYMYDVLTMGTTDIYQLQIPMNGYFRYGDKLEFPNSEGDSLVPTNGISSTFDTSTNAKIMKQFVFKYDGKGKFEFKDPNKSSSAN